MAESQKASALLIEKQKKIICTPRKIRTSESREVRKHDWYPEFFKS